MKIQRVAIYARISTNNGRQDADNQLLELRSWAERLGCEVVKEYVDQASGSRGDREALQQMLHDGHLRYFDRILIWSLDRLSREGIAKTSGYLEELKRSGVRLSSLKESWLDSDGIAGELLIAVFSWVAKQERERIRERILAGLDRARKQGKRLGRPTVRFDTKRALQLRSEGLNVREIATRLNVSKSTVAKYMSVKHTNHSA
jgi:DNA invertase Pin-like site-specific DNA recombinase